ncbi:MAG TPA: TonB-dependent receptor [Longimicrobiales bacterium]|nr:TonB-dependent receptor [Longimicrobiales bacterium]
MEAVDLPRRSCRRRYLPFILLIFLLVPAAAQSQTTGSIVGRIVDRASGAGLEGVQVEVVGTTVRGATREDGRFILGSVPPGERSLRVERIGYKTVVLEGVVVRTGRPQEVTIQLDAAPVVIEGVTVQAERRRLVEPDVSTTHDIVIGRELRELPVDRLAQVIEMTPGVSGGHFRGGRVGQEVHVVDGVELKNQFEASSQGTGLELSPSALEEIEVITGGFGAQYGSALSGVVSYVTRRGSQDGWNGRASALTDQWAPGSLFYGFTALSASAGGPLGFLGGGSTLFLDVLAQGMVDAEPRARGLTCLRAGDADGDLAAEISRIEGSAPGLACPFEHSMLPHQRGDKLIAFARFDRSLGRNLSFNATALRNRVQRELYTPEFRYSSFGQLGQSTVGSLATANLNWSVNAVNRAYNIDARASFMRLDRYLGAVDPVTFSGTRIGGFGTGDFVFFGEDAARAPIEDQLETPQSLPGYQAPGGASGSPYGLAGQGIFFTEGTPHIASWAKTDLLSMDLTNEVLWVNGSSFRAGAAAKLYGIESYERTLSHLVGSSPNYARFYPATMSGFGEARIAVSDEMTFNVGMRVDAFRSGIEFRADRSDFLSPVIDAGWQVSMNPRFGVAMPVPGTNNTAALRFNYGYVSQPPDFRYFLDTAVGDSLRTDIRRQGNPALSFERGKSYEMGISTLIGPNAGASLTVFRKELSHLVSGSLRIGENGDPLYSTDDEGTVNGAELSLRGRWSDLSLRLSYALQKAVGVASGFDADSVLNDDNTFTKYPLAFDRRHSIDFAAFYGRAAGNMDMGWSAALTSSLQSGYPIDRIRAGGGDDEQRGDAYLPWTSTIDLRLSRELGQLPLCGCEWRVTADGRNLLGRENIIALRRDTGGLAPTLAAARALADAMPAPASIPAESPSYSQAADIDRNGIITPDEFRTARLAAAISRFDPSLYFGEPRQVRLGIEVTF